MSVKLRIIFIGGGNLATAIFSRLNTQEYQIIVIQRNQAKRANLTSKYPQIECYPSVNFNFTVTDIVVMAVKPQDAKVTFDSLVDNHLNLPIIVSVMAGITTASLAKLTNNMRIVRTMPNILSSVGIGSTGIFFANTITMDEQNQISAIFSSVGNNHIFDDENDIDIIATVTGSSPAYLYYFFECMIDNACKLGFSKEQATAMTMQVVRGSIELINRNPELTLAELRQSITSKKGTTEVAIARLEQANLADILLNAQIQSIERAKELALGVKVD